MKGLQFENELINILNIYTEENFKEEALDSDEVERLAYILKCQLNLINGNVTEEEYNNLLDEKRPMNVYINYGVEGEQSYTIFNKTRGEIKQIFDKYNKEYDSNKYTGAFEDYMKNNNIEFKILEFDLKLSV